jgi:CubicO group peptidase (beta-lactamase class C family)
MTTRTVSAVNSGTPAVQALADDVVARQAVPGLAVVVVGGDTPLTATAAGTADLHSGTPMSTAAACNWFSMTKIATATAAMMLVEQGRLDLDAPVAQYLGGMWPASFGAARVRHLLSHSSGLGNPIPIRWVHRAGAAGPEPRAFLARLLAKQRRPRFAPGTRAAYTNVGYLALGEVVAEAARQPYESFVRQAVLEPLEMSRTSFAWDATVAEPRATGHQKVARAWTPLIARMLPRGIVGPRAGRFVTLEPFELDGAAYGGLIGPVTDAARLVALFANGGTVDGNRLLHADTVRAMVTVSLGGKPFDLGLGWFRPRGDDGPAVEHLGGGMGFFNLLRVDPTTGSGVAVMSNTTRNWEIAALADRALRAARPDAGSPAA